MCFCRCRGKTSTKRRFAIIWQYHSINYYWRMSSYCSKKNKAGHSILLPTFFKMKNIHFICQSYENIVFLYQSWTQKGFSLYFGSSTAWTIIIKWLSIAARINTREFLPSYCILPNCKSLLLFQKVVWQQFTPKLYSSGRYAFESLVNGWIYSTHC